MKKIELDTRNSLKIDNDLYYYNFSNLDNSKVSVFYETEIRFIQFHFCLSGNLVFEYNNGGYSFPLQKDSSILLFNPSTKLPVNVIMAPETKFISILISIEKFHSLFSETFDSIPFLSKENIDKKYYKETKLSPFIITILTQMFNEKISDNVRKLYIKGKVFELLSLYFNVSKEMDIEQCPFLADDKNVIKIKKVKEIIVARMAEPPSLKELAEEVEISLKNLKEGFKQVYGNTVFGFLIDYKMNIASHMLSSKNYNVNEVAHHLGYSTASHFITAFKNKFGTTPKKYLVSN
tara:strand:+ start:354 stop:1229 length:876 start_codon:yes stop_codon:yes gene_type:complete